MKKYWIYIHTCPNGKRYVGVTTKNKPKERWNGGRGYLYNKHFWLAILKYGWDNIKHETWELTSESEMYYAEKYLIVYYQTNNSRFGYNHSEGGKNSTQGYRHTEETKLKISKSKKGIPKSEEWKHKISEIQKGKKASEETRRKQSEIRKGIVLSEETKQKMSEARKGKPLPRFRYKFPSGIVREMTYQNACKHYINKGIKIILLN